MVKLSHLQELKDPLQWSRFSLPIKLDLESRCYLQIMYSSLFSTSLSSAKEKVPHIGKSMVNRFWEQLKCESLSRHHRKTCTGYKTGWIPGTRDYHHATVWNLWCHLPSGDTSELVTKTFRRDHKGLNAPIFQAKGNSLASCITLEDRDWISC